MESDQFYKLEPSMEYPLVRFFICADNAVAACSPVVWNPNSGILVEKTIMRLAKMKLPKMVNLAS
jgi:hypothetical protein